MLGMVINNTYHSGHVKTDHRVICLIPENVTKNFTLPKLTVPVSGTLSKIIENDTKTRDKIPLNGSEGQKVNLEV